MPRERYGYITRREADQLINALNLAGNGTIDYSLHVRSCREIVRLMIQFQAASMSERESIESSIEEITKGLRLSYKIQFGWEYFYLQLQNEFGTLSNTINGKQVGYVLGK